MSRTEIGGSTQFILNNKGHLPDRARHRAKGVVFAGIGNAYTADDVWSWEQTRAAVGAGMRWLSPLGPLRVELGYPIRTKPHDRKSLILFSFGGPFQF